uniref:Leucine-binding protein domain-containing protein n=1 Tax=Alexandrium monilatum TaxID=311494 RepID=A0A7S4S4N4_9DINO
MAPLVQAAGKVQVAPASSVTSVFRPHSSVFGTLTPNREWLVGAMEAVGAAEESSRKSVMYLSEDLGFTLTTCAEVPRLARLNNMEVLQGQILVPASAGADDMEGVVATLMQRRPDVVVSCTYRAACHALVREMERRRYTPKALIATICVVEADFIEQLGAAGHYAIGVSPWIPSMPLGGLVTGGWTAEGFAGAFEARFGATPPYQAASSFAAAAVLTHAIELAGTLDPAAVAAVLRNLSDHSMYGHIAFDGNGQCTNTIKVLQRHGGDSLLTVHPAGVAQERLVYPKPDWVTRQCLNTLASQPSRFGFLDVCQECPLGRTSAVVDAGRSILRVCAECGAGKMGVDIDFQSCLECPQGTFSDRPGATQCAFCPAGAFGNASGRTACEACLPGAVAETLGSKACSACLPGHYQGSGNRTQCRRCEVGRYAEEKGATACQGCPPSFSTQGTGFSRASDCGCPAEHFNGSRYDPSRTPACEPCPRGVACPGFGAELELRQGYYEAAGGLDPFAGVWLCRPAAACPGGLPGTCADKLEGLGCSICPDGQVLLGTEGGDMRCQECDGLNIALLVFLPFAVLICLVCIYYLANDRVAISTGNVLACSIIFGLSVTVVQVFGMLGQLMVPWPASIEKLVKLSRVLVSDGDAMGLECLVGKGPMEKYLAMFALPFLVVAILGGLAILSLALPRLTRGRLEAWSWRRVFNTLCHMGQALFITVTVVAASPMQCFTHPNGKSTMASFPSVLCFEGGATHARFLLMSFSLLVLLVIPFIAVAAWGSYSVYVSTQTRGIDAPQMTMYRFLVYRFRPSVWWWANVFNVRQLLLGLTPMVTPDDTANQLVYMLFVVLAYLAVMTAFLPWRTLEINLFDMLTTCLIAGIGITMTTFIPASKYEGRQVALLVTITVLTLTCIGLAGAYALVMLKRRGKSGHFGYIFPPPEDMKKFADHSQSIMQSLAGMSRSEFRLFLEELSTIDRLLVDKVVNVFAMTSEGHSVTRGPRRSTFNRSLRLVHPASDEPPTPEGEGLCPGDVESQSGCGSSHGSAMELPAPELEASAKPSRDSTVPDDTAVRRYSCDTLTPTLETWKAVAESRSD